LVFGNLLGFTISWIATIIGCTISFFLFRKLKTKIFHHEKIKALYPMVEKFGNISFEKIVIILAIPFTPAFSINIAAGLSNMSYRKYAFALLISKLFLVYFWGFVGSTLLESITDIGVIVKLMTMVLLAFILSKMVMQKFDLK